MKFVQGLAIVILTAALAVAAQDAGIASGKGTIEQNPFSPRYAFAYGERSGPKTFTWIVLTEKQPPLSSWSAAKDRAEARRAWCEKEKTPFVAVKLDPDWKVDLYFLCPSNGNVNTEMLSTSNGLDSVALTFDVRDGKRVKGTLRTGVGSCPGPGGRGQAYCTPTGDYAFDAVVIK
jgi:hypothetical protein